jgi:hypothetical protein
MSKGAIAIVCLISFTIIGCGGGGAAPPTAVPMPAPTPVIDEELGGVWFGTSTNDQGGANQDLIVVSTDDGRLSAASLTTGAQFVGNISTTGDDLVGSGIAVAPQGFTWSNSTTATAFNITGQLSERAALSSTWNTPATNESGTINIQYDSDVHMRGSTLDKITGNWVSLETLSFSNSGALLAQGTIDGNFAFTSAGVFTGSDVIQCQYSGTASIIDPRYNVYNLSTTVTSCPAFNSTYSGLGVLVDALNPDNTIAADAALILTISDGTTFSTDVLFRN